MPTITINGAPLFYECYDQQPLAEGRPPLILLHGAGGTYLHWPPHLRRLPATLVYALDLPGHGRSRGAALATITAYQQLVEAFMAALAIEQAIIAGHSMGGAIALDLALATPHRVAGLVLVSTGARLRVHPTILQGLESDFAATTAQLVEWMYTPAFPSEQRERALAQLRTNAPQQLLTDFHACNQFDQRAAMSAVQQPTLILCGALDQMTPVSYSTFLQQTITGSELHLIDGVGHMPLVETPAAVTALIERFLAQRYP